MCPFLSVYSHASNPELLVLQPSNVSSYRILIIIVIPLYSNLEPFSFHTKLMARCINNSSAHLRISPHHSHLNLHLREALMRSSFIFDLHVWTDPLVNQAQIFLCLCEIMVKNHSYGNKGWGRNIGGTVLNNMDFWVSWASLLAQAVKNPPAMQETQGLIPVLERNIREGNGYQLQNSCLENPMDREAWWAVVHGVLKSWTQLRDTHTGYLLIQIASLYSYLIPELSFPS